MSKSGQGLDSPHDGRATTLGLLPRLVSACWFAAAASIPIILFLLVFAREDALSPDFFFPRVHATSSNSNPTGIWFFVQFPVSLAAFFGFAIGARILDFVRRRTSFGATLRGIMVAICSYVAMPVIHLVFAVLWQPEPVNQENFLKLVYLMLLVYGVGAILVGWLVVFTGAISGLLLFWASGKSRLRQNLAAAPRITNRRALFLITAAALTLVAANVLLLFLPTLLLFSRRLFFRILDQLNPAVGGLQHAVFVLR